MAGPGKQRAVGPRIIPLRRFVAPGLAPGPGGPLAVATRAGRDPAGPQVTRHSSRARRGFGTKAGRRPKPWRAECPRSTADTATPRPCPRSAADIGTQGPWPRLAATSPGLRGPFGTGEAGSARIPQLRHHGQVRRMRPCRGAGDRGQGAEARRWCRDRPGPLRSFVGTSAQSGSPPRGDRCRSRPRVAASVRRHREGPSTPSSAPEQARPRCRSAPPPPAGCGAARPAVSFRGFRPDARRQRIRRGGSEAGRRQVGGRSEIGYGVCVRPGAVARIRHCRTSSTSACRSSGSRSARPDAGTR